MPRISVDGDPIPGEPDPDLRDAENVPLPKVPVTYETDPGIPERHSMPARSWAEISPTACLARPGAVCGA